MKKLLFLATAFSATIISAAIVSAGYAVAETPELLGARSQGGEFAEFSSQYLDRETPGRGIIPNLEIRLAGVVRTDVQVVDQDFRAMRPGLSIFDNRRDFFVLGGGTADTGLSYGFAIDVGAGRGQVYMSNSYGRLSLGDTRSATQSLRVDGGSVMVGTGHYARGGGKNVNFGSLAGARVVSYRGQGGTVRYTTPTYGGITLSASYTEESDIDMIDGAVAFNQVVQSNHGLGFQWIGSEDIVSLAGQHVSTYGPYTTVLYAGYEYSNRNDKNTPEDANGQQLVSVGAKVTAMGTGFGAGYGYAKHDRPIGLENDRQWIDVALTYEYGAWGFSGGALYLEDEEGAGVIGEAYVYSGSFNYNIAPGLSLMGGVTHFILDNTLHNGDPDSLANAALFGGPAPQRGDNEATTFTLSTQVTF